VEEKICQAIYGLPAIDTTDMEAVRDYVGQLPPLLRGTAGGNTTCVEVQAGGETFIIDAGTGLRKLGLELMKGPCGRGQGTLHLLFSHLHWDHIQGFPFFMPGYTAGNRIIIYSIHDLRSALIDQQRFLNFPVPLSTLMQAELEFVRLQVGVPISIGRVTINTIRNTHPGASYGFRFEDQHSVFVYASDAEYKQLDEAAVQAHLDFFKDADALIFDAQYGLRESWETKVDYGHSSAMIGIDLARKAGAKRLVLFHHEPIYSDTQLQEIQATAIEYQAQDTSLPACEVIMGYEGFVLDLTPAGAVEVQLRPDSEAAVLTPTEVFDERGVEQLTRRLADVAAQDSPVGSIIDLSQVERLTTASLKALVTFSQARTEGSVVLAAPSPAVEQVIKLGGYADYFAVFPSVDEAVKAVQARKTAKLPGQTINGQYQIAEKLGQSALGTVVKVTDTVHNREAALRILSARFGVETIDKFASQVQQLLDLEHRNIAQVYDCDWSQAGDHTYIVEEFLSGPSLGERLGDGHNPISIDEALDIALDLTIALEYAHSRGVIHGNLKPQDVFLTENGAKISGLGLGRLDEGRNLLEAPLVLVTATHLAPEQILGQAVDARTDLYALGVLFYQLFTGRLPFEGEVEAVMQAHLKQTPVPPSKLNPHLSRSVEHLILKLLAKNPNDRYASARQARNVSSSLIVTEEETTSQRRKVVIGREEQLTRLQALWQQARDRRGQLVFVTGEPGIGKTSLAQQLAIISQTPVLLVGHGEEIEGSTAYHLFSQPLRTYFATVPPELSDENLQQPLSNLAQLVPELRQLLPDLPDPAPLEPKQEQLRLMSSLAQLIRQATAERPWLLILDDLHWADQSSLELLRYLGRHLPSLALMILGTYRDDNLTPGHPLRETLRDLSSHPTYQWLSLERLDQAGVGQLLFLLWQQPVPEALVEKIFQHTGGNPFYVEEVAKGMDDDGLVKIHEGLSYFPEADQVRLPRSVHEAVLGRIHHLNPETETLLRQAAVLGQTFRFDDLQAMTRLTEWEVLEHLDTALEQRLVQEASGGNAFRFTHVEIHHVIYAELGTLRRRLLHRQAGEALERRAMPEPEQLAEELAYHFSKAGEFERALVYSIQAARRSEAAYANEAALNWYNLALEVLDQLDPEEAKPFQPLKLSVFRSKGAVLQLVGQWAEAEEIYHQAFQLAELLDDRQAMAGCQAAVGELQARQ
jgi:anti-anti-sigma factor